MNIWDVLIVAGIASLVLYSVSRRRKRQKQGKCSCCDGSACAGCLTESEKTKL